MANAGDLHEWIESLPEHGRYVFSRDEAQRVSEASPEAVKMTLYRLKKRSAIFSPRRGFYVLLPPEYRSAGSPPATWYIDDLMRHLGRPYYVALLTAAALHGAGHQQPMAFQVLVDTVERDIEVGRVRIEFHVSSQVGRAETQRMQTETGTMVVSTPETTAFDLVRYPSSSGYWNNIGTVLSGLVGQVDPLRLALASTRAARSDVQRLGWMLEFLGEEELAEAIYPALQGKRLSPTPLSRRQDASAALLDPKWRVLVNDEVEPDL